MAFEITEKIVLSHINKKMYFSEEEFPQVPLLLINLVKEGRVAVWRVLQFALEQAKVFNNDLVFCICVVAIIWSGMRYWRKDYENGKPWSIFAPVASRMMRQIVIDGEYNPAYENYKKLCGLWQEKEYSEPTKWELNCSTPCRPIFHFIVKGVQFRRDLSNPTKREDYLERP